MIIDFIFDLHGFQPKITGGDLLIIAGDLTGRNLPDEYLKFNTWLSKWWKDIKYNFNNFC